MFEDIPRGEHELEFSPGMTDREIAYVIHLCAAAEDASAADGWRLLFERYPDDKRFLLLHVFERFTDTEKATDRLLRQLRQLADDTPPELRDPFAALLTVINDLVADRGGQAWQTLWSDLAADLPHPEVDASYGLLQRFAGDVIEDCHDATVDGRTLGTAATPPPAPVARPRPIAVDDGRPARPYSPREEFALGDRIAHPTFGPGTVTRKLPGKIEVQFATETKLLVAR